MSFAVDASPCIKSFYPSKLPRDLARSYRGRRIELRQEYEKTKEAGYKKFLKRALQKHAKLMIRDNKPIRSYLWKAEKNGHFVYLFGDAHKIVQKAADFKDVDEKEDLTPLLKTYLHPQILEAFESSESLYVEIFLLKHLDWIKDLSSKLQSLYPKAFKDEHPQGNLYYDQFVQYNAELRSGIVDLMLAIKAGSQTPMQEMGSKLGDFVKEMDDLITSEKAAENAIKLLEEGKIPPGDEIALEGADAVQMGNLDSLTLLDQLSPPELISDIEQRNLTYANCVLNALEQAEKAFFAPGALHYIGEKGILSLLEKQGVAITRIEMNLENG